MKVLPPTPRPCASCPYRREVPSGVWSKDEYEKLREYDRPFIEQPPGVFLCHQTDLDNPRKRVCGGWVGTHHDDELLALRLAVPQGVMSLETLHEIRDYTPDVELFASGTEAADHGMEDIEWPGEDAARMIEKIKKVRSDLRTENPK